MKSEDLAWLAGLLEGEGYFEIKPTASTQGRTKQCCIVLEMTDEDVVRKAHKIAGIGKLSFTDYRGRYGRTKITWRWKAGTRAQIEPLLTQLLPYMGERRSQKIQELLDYLRTVL